LFFYHDMCTIKYGHKPKKIKNFVKSIKTKNIHSWLKNWTILLLKKGKKYIYKKINQTKNLRDKKIQISFAKKLELREKR